MLHLLSALHTKASIHHNDFVRFFSFSQACPSLWSLLSIAIIITINNHHPFWWHNENQPKTKENEPGHCTAMEMMMALMWWASFFSHRNIYLLNGVFALTFAQDIPKISHSHSHQKRFVIGRVKWSGITSTVLASGLVVREEEGWMDDEHDWNNAKQWNVQTVDLGKRQDSHGQPGLVRFLPLCENSFILTKNRETNWQCHCWVTSPHCHHHHRKENCSRL